MNMPVFITVHEIKDDRLVEHVLNANYIQSVTGITKPDSDVTIGLININHQYTIRAIETPEQIMCLVRIATKNLCSDIAHELHARGYIGC